MKVLQAERKEARAEKETALSRNHATTTDVLAMNRNAIERLRADNATAIEQLRVTIAEHNAKIAAQSKDIIKFIAAMAVGIVVVLGGFIAVLRFFT